MNPGARRPLSILGIRGIPAAHGGFETFAERLALHLSERGWAVSVYCQQEGPPSLREEHWRGIRLLHIAVPGSGPRSTMRFDWAAIRHAASHAAAERSTCLTLGYNTALFCAWLRLKGVPNVINMDGIEWRRSKWSPAARAWFWLNERAGCWLGDTLVADHPEIARHLATRVRADKIVTIPYGADEVQDADPAPLAALGLQPGRYLTLIARAEPENSILEIVDGYSRRPRGLPLVVLGHYQDGHPYHRLVREKAGAEVRFVGAIYDRATLDALRVHSLAYVHGHRVGGTNPSLVEALGAGNAVIAHDNPFNRWVAGDAALYFADAAGVDAAATRLLADAAEVERCRAAARRRHAEAFRWQPVLDQYEALLASADPRHRARPEALTSGSP